MSYYAVIDTNVLVSSLLTSNKESPTVQVVQHLFDGGIIPLFSDAILKEYEDVLYRKSFIITPREMMILLNSGFQY